MALLCCLSLQLESSLTVPRLSLFSAESGQYSDCLCTFLEFYEILTFDFFFFRGGKDREGEMRYNPFRITPYLLKVEAKGRSGKEEVPCCLALAERIISGYEGYKFEDKCWTLRDIA